MKEEEKNRKEIDRMVRTDSFEQMELEWRIF